MYNFPFFGFPYYRNYYSNHHYANKNISENDEKNSTTNDKYTSSTINDNSRVIHDEGEPFINILGINLYSDDTLILCILLSLYLEGVKDEMLFISLILLLLT